MLLIYFIYLACFIASLFSYLFNWVLLYLPLVLLLQWIPLYIDSLWVVCCTWHTHVLLFPLQLYLSLYSYMIHMRVNGNLPNVSWGTSEVLHVIAFTTHQGILTLFVIQTQIMLMILMIKSLLQVLFSFLVLVLSHSLARIIMLTYYHL